MMPVPRFPFSGYVNSVSLPSPAGQASEGDESVNSELNWPQPMLRRLPIY